MSIVSEIMNTQVLSVHPEDRLEDVVKILTDNKIGGLPVVDNDNKVVGIVTDRDILRFSEDVTSIPYIPVAVWALPYEFPLDINDYKKSAESLLNTQVREIMSKRVHAIRETALWHDAVILMKRNSVNRVPVIDGDGKLKGILTRTDLLHYIAEQHEEQ